MNALNNVRIGTKLIGGFLVVALLATIIAVIGYTGMNSLKALADDIYDNHLIPIEQLSNVNGAVMQMRGDVYKFILLPEERAETEKAIAADIETVNKEIGLYRATELSAEDQAELPVFDAAWATYQKEVANVLAQVKAGNQDAAIQSLLDGGSASNARKAIGATNTKLVDSNVRAADEQDQKGDAQASSSKTLFVVVTVVGVLAAIGLSVVVSRSITGPTAKAVTMIQEMSQGNLSTRLKMDRGDEVGIMAKAMDQLADNFQTVVAEVGALIKAGVEGKLATRGDASKYQGAYKEIVQGMNDTLDAVIGPLNVAAEYVDRISKGDIPTKITDKYNGDFNEIKNNLNTCIDQIGILVDEVGVVIAAGREGHLSQRSNPDRTTGVYRKLLRGINDTLDAVIGPLNVAAEYVDRIAKGDIPAKITDAYHGDFNEIKNNLNTCIDAVNALVADAHLLSKAAVEGKLATRADAGKHQGDFRKIVQGVNDTLDAIVAPLNASQQLLGKLVVNDWTMRMTGDFQGDYKQLADTINALQDQLAWSQKDILQLAAGDPSGLRRLRKLGKLSENDQMLPALTEMMQTIQNLTDEMKRLSKAAVEGKLATRGDTDKFQGAYRDIVQGVNDTLDAVIGPLNVAAEYVDRIAKGEVPSRITDSYHGDFNEIKNNLNMLIEATDQMDNAAQKMAAGDLSVQVNLRSDKDVLAKSMMQAVATLRELLAETNQLTQAAGEGKLTVRSNADRFQGGYRDIVNGMNDMLNGVVAPINDAQQVLTQVARGDLTVTLNGHYKGDYALLKTSIETMLGGLKGMAGQTQQGAVSLSSATAEILASSTQMASTTREQASAVNQITSTVQEIKASAEQVAQRAQSVAEGATRAAEVAQKGTRAADESLKGMDDIRTKVEAIAENILALSEQTQQIGDIIDTVTDIAGQSNILALNAAIEAAQAGEAGKGFRVVADEVRSLAEQSRQAAAQVKVILGDIQKATNLAVMATEQGTKGVNAGSEQVSRTAQTIQELARAVEQSAQAAQQIVAGVEQQTIGLDQIAIGMGDINQAAQQTASGAQQSQTAAQDLTNLASQLKAAVAQYRL